MKFLIRFLIIVTILIVLVSSSLLLHIAWAFMTVSFALFYTAMLLVLNWLVVDNVLLHWDRDSHE